jgi:hypothetical protein
MYFDWGQEGAFIVSVTGRAEDDCDEVDQAFTGRAVCPEAHNNSECGWREVVSLHNKRQWRLTILVEKNFGEA